MDSRLLLTKAITLIYRCRLLNTADNDDLIRTIVNTIKTDAPEYKFNGYNYISELKDFALELLNERDVVAKEVILQRLSLILENDQKLLKVVKESIEPDYDDASNKRIIASLIKSLNNFYKEHLAIDILSKVTFDLKFKRNKITNFSEYLRQAINDLEPLTASITSLKDPALVNEVDFSNPETLTTVFEEVKNLNNNKSIYKLGWHALNRMLQGGIRRGEFVTIGALQHKYKTGMSLSMFMQIATENKPVITSKEKDKKPLLLRISFEDSLTNNLQFMYQYLKCADGEIVKAKDFEYLTTKEMSDYIMKKLNKTGFSIKMLRVDPSQWTYSSVINKIIELEAQGYAIHVLMLDYATLLPTTGCVQGVAGADKKDLLRRLRNFCSGRDISFITPLQLSSEAKMLLRNGIPEHEFVKTVAQKGYYDGCKSLDQDIDLELFIHIFSHKRKKYLSVARGKHRIPTVIDDEDMFFMLPFPGINIPVLPDINKDDTSMRKLPRGYEDVSGTNSLVSELLD
jgi:hypothetical protein